MRNLRYMTVLVLASTALAGCQSPFLASLGFGKRHKEARPPAVALVGAQLIEEGRAQLADGRISEAAASFFLARQDPSTAAQAENGLGVAYARLGRFDLADRFFRAAIARDPQDMRYTANLLRLQQQVMLARRSREPVAPALAGIAPQPTPEKLATATPPVHRISDGIVRITTAEELGAKPTMAIAYLERPAGKGVPLEPASTAVPIVAPDAEAATDVPKQKQKMVTISQ